MYAVSSTVTVKAYFHFHTKSFVRNLRFCFELEIDSTYSGNIFLTYMLMNQYQNYLILWTLVVTRNLRSCLSLETFFLRRMSRMDVMVPT